MLYKTNPGRIGLASFALTSFNVDCCNFSLTLFVLLMMTTDYKYIEQLLDKYFECKTTLGEEQILRIFFTGCKEDVPAHLLPYCELFAEQAEKDTLGADFDNRIKAIISSPSGREGGVPVVRAKVVSINKRLRPLYKAAACVAIVLALGQAAQMPYYQSEAEQQEQLARSLEQLQQIQKDRNAVAQSDTVLKLKIKN